MHYTLTGRADEFAHLTDLIRKSLLLADAAIPPINDRLAELASLGIDGLELEGPPVFSPAASNSPAFDDERLVYAAALTMPRGLGATLWTADEHAGRYGELGREPPQLRERFIEYTKCPPIVRAMPPAHAPKLVVEPLQSFHVQTQ